MAWVIKYLKVLITLLLISIVLYGGTITICVVSPLLSLPQIVTINYLTQPDTGHHNERHNQVSKRSSNVNTYPNSFCWSGDWSRSPCTSNAINRTSKLPGQIVDHFKEINKC